MKKFGEPFKKFDMLEIKSTKIVSPEILLSKSQSDYGNKSETIGYHAESSGPPKDYNKNLKNFLLKTDILKKDIDEPILAIAPTANVYQIPPNEPKVADQIKKDFSKFNFFIVELGLNVMLARGIKVPELRLNVDLKCNTDDRTDVTAVDVAPKDQFKDIKIISGKIYLGVNELLNFVPSTSIKLLSKIIKIDLDPIPFSWTIKKCMINTSGPKNYKVSWLIYETDTVESFNPMLILKARKNVRKITAKAKGIYIQQTGLITKHNETLPSKTIRIWPT